MITHSIKLSKPFFSGKSGWPWKVGIPTPPPKLSLPWVENIGPSRLGKYEYAKYLQKWPHRVNDLVCFHTRRNANGEIDYLNIQPESVYAVTAIQEMHGFVQYDGQNRPKSLELCPMAMGDGRFWTSMETWFVLDVNKLNNNVKQLIQRNHPIVYAHSYNSFNQDPEPDPVG